MCTSDDNWSPWSRLARPIRKIASKPARATSNADDDLWQAVRTRSDLSPEKEKERARYAPESSESATDRRARRSGKRNAGRSYRSIGTFPSRRDRTKRVRVFRPLSASCRWKGRASPDFTFPRNSLDIAGFAPRVGFVYVPVWAGGCAFAHSSVAGRTVGVELFADPCQRLRGCRHLQPSTGSDGRRALPVKMPARTRHPCWRVKFHILNAPRSIDPPRKGTPV